MKKRAISVVLAMIVFVSALSVPSFAYSRTNAVNYANTYALSCNPNHKYFTRGGNCTNFVSQCMYAGGVKTDSTWNFTQGVVSTYNTYTRAWTVADELKNYKKTIWAENGLSLSGKNTEILRKAFMDM